MGKGTDLSTTLSGVALDNPIVLASGFLGVAASTLKRAADLGLGAVTIKSIGPERREGHSEPVVCEVPGGLLNCVGLSTQGPDEAVEELRKAIAAIDKPIIASFYGKSVDDYALLAEKIDAVKPPLLEANISCPNVKDEFGLPFAAKAESTAAVVTAIKEQTKIPLFVKLTPNVPDIASIAKAAVEAGAAGITAVNSVGPGMKIDLESRKPVLSNKSGGLSGPAIKPVAVRCVYDITQAVDVPVIGTGGVTTGEDAVEMLLAGASAVGVGTALMYRGLTACTDIPDEIATYMEHHGYTSVTQLIGAAHD